MSETISLEPYIYFHSDGNSSGEYVAYIPYYTINEKIIENSTPSGSIAQYLGLPFDRSDYAPTYTYVYGNNFYEIGIKGKNLNKIKESINNIQKLLENHNCKVIYNDNIKIETYND